MRGLLLLLGCRRALADPTRGVAEYFDTLPATIPPCRFPHPAACVHVSPRGRIVHGRDLGSSKQMLLDMFLRGALKRLRCTAAPKSPSRRGEARSG